MPFQRPKPIRSLDKTQRATLLQSYFDHYREAAKNDVKSLNQKIPREAFECLLDRIGCILLDHAHATAAADAPGTVRDFLKEALRQNSWVENGLIPGALPQTPGFCRHSSVSNG
jgi:hypothetical protein